MPKFTQLTIGEVLDLILEIGVQLILCLLIIAIIVFLTNLGPRLLEEVAACDALRDDFPEYAWRIRLGCQVRINDEWVSLSQVQATATFFYLTGLCGAGGGKWPE